MTTTSTTSTTSTTVTTTTSTSTTTTTPVTGAEAEFLVVARRLASGFSTDALLTLARGACEAADRGVGESFVTLIGGNKPEAVRRQYALVVTAAGDKLCPEHATELILAASKISR